MKIYGCLETELDEARQAGSDSNNWRWAVQVRFADNWQAISYRYPVRSAAEKAIALEPAGGPFRVIRLA